MKKSTGKKIIILADILFAICIVSLAISGLAFTIGIAVVLMNQGEMIGLRVGGAFLLIALSLYVSSLLLRGYGELVNNSAQLNDKADLIVDQMTRLCGTNQDPDMRCCKVCNVPQKKENKFCDQCGMPLD